MKKINLTKKQFIWLESRGDRDQDDVCTDKKGLYVFMYNGFGGQEKVYIPDDDKLKLCHREGSGKGGYDVVSEI